MFSHPTKLRTKTLFFRCKRETSLVFELNTLSYDVLLQNKREFDLGREMKLVFISSGYKYPLDIKKGRF